MYGCACTTASLAVYHVAVKDNGSVPPLPTFASPPMSSSAAAVGLEPLYDPQGLRLLA